MLLLLLELILEVLQEGVIEVFTTQVSVTCSCLHCEDTTTDVEQRNIEGSSTEIEDQNVLLRFRLTIQTVRDGSGSGLVDDTEDVEASDETSILSCQTLRVIEVGGDTIYSR